MKRVISSFAIFVGLCASAAGLDFAGAPQPPVAVAPDASTGLEYVYVLPSTQGVTAFFATSSPGDAKCYRFSNLGGAFAEEIAASPTSGGVQWALSQGDMGYVVDDGYRRQCFWVVDYSRHTFTATTLRPSADSDCGSLRLLFEGNASDITYYTVNGRPVVLSRELTLTGQTLEFDRESFSYRPVATEQTLASAGTGFNVPAPLCDTRYTLEGDRFLRAWGRSVSVESPTVTATAVACESDATQTERNADNEQRAETSGLGGSAPCEITFRGAVTDAAVFHEWQVSRTPDFDIIENSYPDLETTLTFRDQGNTYVRLLAANGDGTCTAETPVYEISVGDSRLEIPNAFSPQTSPGVNDEWKVSFRSLVSYECHIFNRAGACLFSSTDPAQGWDGKYRGRFVPAGVYYYVIRAEGADGILYKKAGDINIVGFSEGNYPQPEE